MKEFWTLCILVMTVSETVMVETIPYSNIGTYFGGQIKLVNVVPKSIVLNIVEGFFDI